MNLLLCIKRPFIWLSRFRHRCGYGVHSPFAFSLITDVIYEKMPYYAYSSLKEEQKKMLEVTGNLTSAEADLMHILGRLGVIDTHVWIAQVKAILNPKEMVEVRHNLSVRRQKLRKQIEYNENRIEDAKNNIKNITRNNPAYAKDAMEILEKYLPKL